MTERRYLLERPPTGHACRVTVTTEDGEVYDLWGRHLATYGAYHSPTGFEWGYGGSGPAELARAVLSDFLGREAERSQYQRFKFQVIARIPHRGTELTLMNLPEDLGGFTCVGTDAPWAPKWEEVLRP